MAYLRCTATTLGPLGLAAVLVAPLAIFAADRVNPDQAAIDAINDKKALIEAQDALLKAQASLVKSQSPLFGDSFGKDGSLSIESAERDKFHVSARSAESFASAAQQIATIVKTENKTVSIVTDADRAALPAFWSERTALQQLERDIALLLGAVPIGPTPESTVLLLGLGQLLAQVAQFTQLARTDRSVAFTDSQVPDDVLLDLLAAEVPKLILYPAAAVDGLVANAMNGDFGKRLSALQRRRGELSQLASTNSKGKERATELLASLDELLKRLAAVDQATKVPVLLTVLRGELVDESLAISEGRVLSVRVISKGGASLRTSSIWRSDHLYASGGIVVSYRLTSGTGPNPVLRAGVVVAETAFRRVQLD